LGAWPHAYKESQTWAKPIVKFEKDVRIAAFEVRASRVIVVGTWAEVGYVLAHRNNSVPFDELFSATLGANDELQWAGLVFRRFSNDFDAHAAFAPPYRHYSDRCHTCRPVSKTFAPERVQCLSVFL
jgi:hypothetical protein